MKTRLYKQSDLEAVLKLFYDNIHTVCVNDYTLEQLDAWAPKEPDVYRWQASLNRNHTLVVENESQIIGFGDVGETGYLDRLYVHPDYLHQGIASLILIVIFPVSVFFTSTFSTNSKLLIFFINFFLLVLNMAG